MFGAIDIVVTPTGEYVFLEINQMGQFLWLESLNPDFRLLDIFIRFMLSKDRCFNADAHAELGLRLADFDNSFSSVVGSLFVPPRRIAPANSCAIPE